MACCNVKLHQSTGGGVGRPPDGSDRNNIVARCVNGGGRMRGERILPSGLNSVPIEAGQCQCTLMTFATHPSLRQQASSEQLHNNNSLLPPTGRRFYFRPSVSTQIILYETHSCTGGQCLFASYWNGKKLYSIFVSFLSDDDGQHRRTDRRLPEDDRG